MMQVRGWREVGAAGHMPFGLLLGAALLCVVLTRFAHLITELITCRQGAPPPYDDRLVHAS